MTAKSYIFYATYVNYLCFQGIIEFLSGCVRIKVLPASGACERTEYYFVGATTTLLLFYILLALQEVPP